LHSEIGHAPLAAAPLPQISLDCNQAVVLLNFLCGFGFIFAGRASASVFCAAY
jgi:hypothetical protein